MTGARQKYVTPRASKFSQRLKRDHLPFFLDNLGMRDRGTNQPLVSEAETNYMIDCIKDDLKIPRRIPVWVNWFETGSVFSEANDEFGNMAFNVHIGNKGLDFQVTFDKNRNNFPGLYFESQEISFASIQKLF